MADPTLLYLMERAYLMQHRAMVAWVARVQHPD